jgi:hypothetical protein
MKNYSIVRVGNEYVVQADEKSVLRIASRRRAARTVTDATELLDSQQKPQAGAEPSIARDLAGIADPGIIPVPGITPDPGIPDPREVP